MIPPAGARPPRQPDRRARRGIWMLVSFATAGSLAAVAVVLVYTAAATGPRKSATVVDPILGGGPGCVPTRTEQLVRGNGVGSTDSGPEVILAFQHAYYVTRSGTTARGVTAPDATVTSAELINAGIATVPEGTTHCVLITPLPDGRFDVVISETRPNSTMRTYRQFVSVAGPPGAVLITAITPPS